jgi:hypothetical protein
MNEMNGIPRPEHARLQLWTVYDSPLDYPGLFVARMSLVGAGGGTERTEHRLVSSDLTAIRTQLMAWGLHCLTRHPDDAPHILEVWL